jgi:3-phenylpropionate/trans-cinnamate dioxygenase ferredoxin reductase subunit
MEYLGFVAGPDAYDEVVVSGSLPDRELVAFWVKDGRVEAGMAVNVWDRMEDVKALIHRDAVDRAELESFVG